MKEILYLDTYFALNFVMDLVSLALAGLISGEKARLWRMCLAASFGALASAILILLPFGSLLSLFFGLLTFFAMIYFSFGRLSFRRGGFLSLFAFLSALFLGGAVESISYYTQRKGNVTLGVLLATLFLAFGAFTLWGKGLKKKMESSVISLSIVHGGREEQLFGLVDSGSFLREPTRGAPVILLKAEYAAGLLSPEELRLLQVGTGDGVYPVPMKTASGFGCLFGFFPVAVYLHRPGKKKQGGLRERVLVALDFSGGGFGGCPCLVPLSIL